MKLHRDFGELFTSGGVPVLAVRANLLVIAGLTMSAEVILHLVPVLHVVSMSFTGRADGQKVLQYAFTRAFSSATSLVLREDCRFKTRSPTRTRARSSSGSKGLVT